ncbi:Wall-associated receptor kinase, galacturonan-binding domain [Sesbania bispinosa]|nr:Wall-associated receptor kinase, galacturonan-binding domain [Sesbania bispinosa]
MEEQTHIHIHILMLLSSISLWLLTTLPQFSHCQPPPPQGYNYSVCKEESYNCGELSNISYPFWGQNRPSYCGGGDSFKLNCQQEEEDHNTTTIRIGSQDFTVLNIHTTSYSMRLVRTDLARNVCYPQFNNTYLSPSVLIGVIPIFLNFLLFIFPHLGEYYYPRRVLLSYLGSHAHAFMSIPCS